MAVLLCSTFFIAQLHAAEIAPAGAVIEITKSVRANCGGPIFRTPLAAGVRFKLAEAWYSIAQEMYVYDTKGKVCSIRSKYFGNVRVVEKVYSKPVASNPAVAVGNSGKQNNGRVIAAATSSVWSQRDERYVPCADAISRCLNTKGFSVKGDKLPRWTKFTLLSDWHQEDKRVALRAPNGQTYIYGTGIRPIKEYTYPSLQTFSPLKPNLPHTKVYYTGKLKGRRDAQIQKEVIQKGHTEISRGTNGNSFNSDPIEISAISNDKKWVWVTADEDSGQGRGWMRNLAQNFSVEGHPGFHGSVGSREVQKGSKKGAVDTSCSSSTFIKNRWKDYQVLFATKQTNLKSAPRRRCGYTHPVEPQDRFVWIGETKDYYVLTTPENYPHTYHYLEKSQYGRSFRPMISIPMPLPRARNIFEKVLTGERPEPIGVAMVIRNSAVFSHHSGVTRPGVGATLSTDDRYDVVYRDNSPTGRSLVRMQEQFFWARNQDISTVSSEVLKENTYFNNEQRNIARGWTIAGLIGLFLLYFFPPGNYGRGAVRLASMYFEDGESQSRPWVLSSSGVGFGVAAWSIFVEESKDFSYPWVAVICSLIIVLWALEELKIIHESAKALGEDTYE